MQNQYTKAGEPTSIIPRNGVVDKPADLLNQLLDRGDKVSIKGGKLVLIPASDNPVPDGWLKENESELVERIAVQTGIVIFRYTEYSTGAYSAHFFQGVTLQFDCIATLTDAYAIFNCILTRARTTKHGAADKPLPKNHFRLSRKHQLTKFLKRSGIEPRRLSDAYKSMGKLKGLLFSATYVLNKGDRLQSDSITPLNLTHQELIELLKTPRQQCDNSATKPRQQCDNSATKYRDKETADSNTQKDFQPTSSTCASNYGKRTTLQGNTVTSVSTTLPISTSFKGSSEGKGNSVQKLSQEEWLSDYDDEFKQRRDESSQEWWERIKSTK